MNKYLCVIKSVLAHISSRGRRDLHMLVTVCPLIKHEGNVGWFVFVCMYTYVRICVHVCALCT